MEARRAEASIGRHEAQGRPAGRVRGIEALARVPWGKQRGAARPRQESAWSQTEARRLHTTGDVRWRVADGGQADASQQAWCWKVSNVQPRSLTLSLGPWAWVRWTLGFGESPLGQGGGRREGKAGAGRPVRGLLSKSRREAK